MTFIKSCKVKQNINITLQLREEVSQNLLRLCPDPLQFGWLLVLDLRLALMFSNQQFSPKNVSTFHFRNTLLQSYRRRHT